MSKLYPHRTRPFKGLAAFHHVGEDTSPSQAAVLLHMGNQLRGGDVGLKARAAVLRRKGFVASASMDEFPVPMLRQVGGVVPFDESRERLQRLHGYKASLVPAPARDGAMFEGAFRGCAERVFSKPLAAHAADLFAMGMEHPRELVRIAAAIASLPLSTRPQHNVRVLVKGLKSADNLERTLAATGLARNYPEHPALRPLSRGRTAKLRKKPPETLMLIHGTWASDAPWYQPGGDFFTFIGALRKDLYGQADFFKWSGGWSDGARQDGATTLQAWVTERHEQGLDLMGHSHGANVILKATDLGLKLGKVVLLSCPVHVDKYFPNFANLGKPVFSVRVKHDLVILADGGGQCFTHPDIREIVLPIWFDHGATHEPKVWQDQDIARKVAL